MNTELYFATGHYITIYTRSVSEQWQAVGICPSLHLQLRREAVRSAQGFVAGSVGTPKHWLTVSSSQLPESP